MANQFWGQRVCCALTAGRQESSGGRCPAPKGSLSAIVMHELTALYASEDLPGGGEPAMAYPDHKT